MSDVVLDQQGTPIEVGSRVLWTRKGEDDSLRTGKVTKVTAGGAVIVRDPNLLSDWERDNGTLTGPSVVRPNRVIVIDGIPWEALPGESA